MPTNWFLEVQRTALAVLFRFSFVDNRFDELVADEAVPVFIHEVEFVGQVFPIQILLELFHLHASSFPQNVLLDGGGPDEMASVLLALERVLFGNEPLHLHVYKVLELLEPHPVGQNYYEGHVAGDH